MKVSMSSFGLMLVALWSITTLTGYARPLVMNDMGESSDMVKYSNPVAPQFVSGSTNRGESSNMINSEPVAPEFVSRSTYGESSGMVNSEPVAPEFVSRSTSMGQPSDMSNSEPVAPEFVSRSTSLVLSEPAHPEFVPKSATSDTAAEPDPGRFN